MDYESKYRKLKDYIVQSQSDKMIDPSAMDTLSTFKYAYKDRLLSDEAHVAIATLIADFMKLSDVRGNVELSKHYAVGKGLRDRGGDLICEDCELVLRYDDDAICWSNGNIVDPDTVGCNLSRGLITVAVKIRKGKNSYTYEDLKVIRIRPDIPTTSAYANVPEMKRLNEANQIAHTRALTETVGQLGGFDPNLNQAVYQFNDLSHKVKQGAINAQMPSLTANRVTAFNPSDYVVDIAKTITSGLDDTYKAFVVPSDHSVPLHSVSNNQTSQVVGQLTPHGARIQSGGGSNTINSKVASRRVSMTVDGTIAVMKEEVAKQQVAISDSLNKLWDGLKGAWSDFVSGISKPVTAVPVTEKLAIVEPKLEESYSRTEPKLEESLRKIEQSVKTDVKPKLEESYSRIKESLKNDETVNKLSDAAKNIGTTIKDELTKSLQNISESIHLNTESML